MKKSIGILGGMGPMATVDLFSKIVNLTRAQNDNEHIRIYIDNNAFIPDRTEAILFGGTNPLPQMSESLRKLESCGADCIIMPCNTAHYFLNELRAQTNIPFISILESCAKACEARFGKKKVAILGTKGTLAANLYQKALDSYNIPYLLPDSSNQDALMRVIYDGVKAGKECESYSRDVENVVESMKQEGAEYFILGCTELPIAFNALKLPVSTIDPTEELAKSAIIFCGYEVKN